jgi:sulfoxide reductase heme-binding subunit YedZ
LAAHIISAAPAIMLAADAISQNLTANPVQAVTLRTGNAAIHLLLLTLACTPLSRIFRFTSLVRMRIIFGLYTFFYSLVHFMVFSGWDYQFRWGWISAEITTKPFLQIGIFALVILFLLAVTSISAVRIGLKKKWKKLQSLVYLAGGMMIWHTILAAKGDISLPVFRGIIFLLLMILRVRTVSDHLTIRVKWIEAINQFLLT